MGGAPQPGVNHVCSVFGPRHTATTSAKQPHSSPSQRFLALDENSRPMFRKNFYIVKYLFRAQDCLRGTLGSAAVQASRLRRTCVMSG